MTALLPLLAAIVLAIVGWVVGSASFDHVAWAIGTAVLGAFAGLMLAGGFFTGAVFGWLGLAKLKADEHRQDTDEAR